MIQQMGQDKQVIADVIGSGVIIPFGKGLTALHAAKKLAEDALNQLSVEIDSQISRIADGITEQLSRLAVAGMTGEDSTNLIRKLQHEIKPVIRSQIRTKLSGGPASPMQFAIPRNLILDCYELGSSDFITQTNFAWRIELPDSDTKMTLAKIHKASGDDAVDKPYIAFNLVLLEILDTSLRS